MPIRALGPIDRVFVTYVFLRQGLTYDALGALFGVHWKVISRIVKGVLPLLAKFFNHVFPVPTKQQLLETFPPSWKETLNGQFVAYIIDGCEFFTEVPGNPAQQALLYSYYKHHCTGKFLVALTPDGYIAFVSKVYGGRITDQELVHKCGFLEHLKDRGMNVMADKGFTSISGDLIDMGAYLLAPSRKGDRAQFTTDETKVNATVSHLRIHVERAIKLLKNFGILQKTLPFEYWPHIDDILSVIRGTVSLMGPTTDRNSAL